MKFQSSANLLKNYVEMYTLNSESVIEYLQ